MSDQTYHTDGHIEFKVHLLRRGLSQRRIAKELGITVQYLNDVLRGKRKGTRLRGLLISNYHIPADLVAYRPIRKAA